MNSSQEYRNDKKPLKEIGNYINDCRVNRKYSLQHLSMRLGVNPSYLREVERGDRAPDDEFIRSLAEICGLDENYIYSHLGKTPLIAREELEHHSLLQDILKEIGMSSISEEKKIELYKKFYLMTKNTLTDEK